MSSTFFAIALSTPTGGFDIMLGDTDGSVIDDARAGWSVFQAEELTIDDGLRIAVDKWLSEFVQRETRFKVIKGDETQGRKAMPPDSVDSKEMGGFTHIYEEIMVVFRFNTKYRHISQIVDEIKGIYLIEYTMALKLEMKERVDLIPNVAFEARSNFFFFEIDGGVMLNFWCHNFDRRITDMYLEMIVAK